MIFLEILWWLGWAYFAAWAALPLLAVRVLGGGVGLIAWAVLAPWSALFGMAGLHRLLPRSDAGKFSLWADRGSVRWALKGWAPSVYLTVFQPLFFQSLRFQQVAMWAFGARLGRGALVTSRTIIREPHRVRVGPGSLIGEYAHLVCSYQPRPGILDVGDIVIGDAVLVGAYTQLGPGVRIGSGCVLEHAVRVGPHSTIGAASRIGAGTAVYNRVRIGDHVTIGKGCLIPSGTVIGDGVCIPDGTMLTSPEARPVAGQLA